MGARALLRRGHVRSAALTEIVTRKKGEVTEITAGGIVFNGDKVLVLRNLKGVGVFPKGHVELGESHEQTALREVLEETGLRAGIVGKAGMSSFHFYSYLDKAVHRKIVYWFEMETTDTVVTVNRELRMGGFPSRLRKRCACSAFPTTSRI